MTLSEYIDLYGFTFTDVSIPEISEVRREASEHVYRTYDNDLVSKKRPVESEAVKEWRKANKRFINHEVIDTVLSECRTNIYATGFNLFKSSENLKDWINNKSFKYLLSDVNLWEFYLNSILPEAIADPNGYVFCKPINPENPESAPSQMPAFNQVEIELMQIPSWQIRVTKSDDVFVIWGGEIVLDKQKLAWYWTGDKDEIYQAIPIDVRNGEIVYRFDLWYRHEIGKIPLVIYPGRISKNEQGATYQESLFKPAMAYLNEFVNSFSDDQWMRLKNNYATLILPAVSCQTCMGEKMIKVGDKMDLCTSCGGSGKMKAPGLTEFMVLPSFDGLDSKTETRNPFYLSPDIGSLAHSWETSFDLLDKAAASLGVNPLIKNAESGEAMKMRMEKLNKTINMVYQASVRFMEDVLYLVESYLIVNPGQRIKPVLKQEFNITVRDLAYLKEVYKDALPIEKLNAVLSYLNVKYQNDPVELLKFQTLARYYPETLLSIEEVRNLVSFGVLTEEEYIRSKQAIWAIEEVIETEPNFIELSKAQIFEKIEGVINNRQSGINRGLFAGVPETV